MGTNTERTTYINLNTFEEITAGAVANMKTRDYIKCVYTTHVYPNKPYKSMLLDGINEWIPWITYKVKYFQTRDLERIYDRAFAYYNDKCVDEFNINDYI